MFYRINFDELNALWDKFIQKEKLNNAIVPSGAVESLIMPKVGKPHCPKWENHIAQSGKTTFVYTENTTENTTENKGPFVEGQKPFDLASLLLKEILRNNSKSRLHALDVTAKNRTLQRWAKDIDLLIRQDKQDTSVIEEVIYFATADDFWGANILSGKKLREKWDPLVKRKEKEEGVRWKL
jgi:hypothetical protein